MRSPSVKMRAGSYIRSKKNKKTQWGSRERSGMSFLIVIAFFAVFGLIILTEVRHFLYLFHKTLILLILINQLGHIWLPLPRISFLIFIYEGFYLLLLGS